MMIRAVDETWRLLHLLAAAYWLGGLLFLAVATVLAHRALEPQAFRGLVSRLGRAFLVSSAAAWIVLGVSGLAMAGPRLGSLGQLTSSAWGRLLGAKTILAGVAIVLTAAHTLTGRHPSSRAAVIASRTMSPLIFAVTVGIYYLAVRLTEG